MAVRQTGRKQYRTMQGKSIDMDLLRQRNELTPAVGNVRVNARGDELGPGGKIIRKREEVLRDYYEENVPAVEFEANVIVLCEPSLFTYILTTPAFPVVGHSESVSVISAPTVND